MSLAKKLSWSCQSPPSYPDAGIFITLTHWFPEGRKLIVEFLRETFFYLVKRNGNLL